MEIHRAAVWIDHREAHVFHVEPETFTTSLVSAPAHVLRHPRYEAQPHNHPQDEHRFFAAIAQSLAGVDSVLVMGPADEKLHFCDYVNAHSVMLTFGIVGVETVDHPTDRQLAAHVRQYFGTPPISQAVHDANAPRHQ